MTDSNRMRGRLLSILPAALILFVGLAAYWPVFGINFFWEDPFDIGQVEGHSLAQLLLLPNSNSYYRPLALVWAKLSLGNGLEHSTLPFHIAIIGAHLLSAVLLYGAARRWLRDQWAGVAAAALFLLYPVAFENTARVYSQHSIFTAMALGVLWLYSAGRESGRRWPIMIALGLSVPAVLFHENGVLLAPMAMALEAYLFWQKRVNRMSRLPLLFLIPAIKITTAPPSARRTFHWPEPSLAANPPQASAAANEGKYITRGETAKYPIGRVSHARLVAAPHQKTVNSSCGQRARP